MSIPESAVYIKRMSGAVRGGRLVTASCSIVGILHIVQVHQDGITLLGIKGKDGVYDFTHSVVGNHIVLKGFGRTAVIRAA